MSNYKYEPIKSPINNNDSDNDTLPEDTEYLLNSSKIKNLPPYIKPDINKHMFVYQRNISTKDIPKSTMFDSFHYHEPYNPDNDYNNENLSVTVGKNVSRYLRTDFKSGYGMCVYKIVLYIVNSKEYYVVYEEAPEVYQDFYKILTKHCRCSRCCNYSFLPSVIKNSVISTPKEGCFDDYYLIDTVTYTQELINKTRKYLRDNGIDIYNYYTKEVEHPELNVELYKMLCEHCRCSRCTNNNYNKYNIFSGLPDEGCFKLSFQKYDYVDPYSYTQKLLEKTIMYIRSNNLYII
jgi:hypothetical protein